MHQHPQADDHVEGAIGEVELVRVAAEEVHRHQLFRGPPARHGQHLLRCVDGGHACAAAGEHQRRPPGAGADVENAPLVDAADHVRQHPGLLGGDQLADRSAEPALVERPRHRRIGVDGVAVVLARLRHARSLATAAGPGGVTSAAQARRVRSRYAS